MNSEVWMVYCNNSKMKNSVKKVLENKKRVLKLEQFIGRIEILEGFDNYVFIEVIAKNDRVYEAFRNLNGARLLMNDGQVLKLSEDEKKRYGF